MTMSVGTGLWPHLGADLPRISPIRRSCQRRYHILGTRAPKKSSCRNEWNIPETSLRFLVLKSEFSENLRRNECLSEPLTAAAMQAEDKVFQGA